MDSRPIGFFDSGLGGISVLRAARALLPNEDYIYYGDSANAPYGTKPAEEIIVLSDAVVRHLLGERCKAIVVACNTATGTAVDTLRERYPQLPFIGVEPAVKPAAEAHPGGRILVLATPQCLQSARVTALLHRYDDLAEPVAVPCGGLMEFVERGELEGPALDSFLTGILTPYLSKPAQAAVLGCTHYPFLSRTLRRLLPAETELIDGNAGIAAQLKRVLEARDLINGSGVPGSVRFENSSDDPVLSERSRMLFELPEL